MRRSTLLLTLSGLSLFGMAHAQSNSPNPLANSSGSSSTTGGPPGAFGPAVLTGFDNHLLWTTAMGGASTLVDFDALADGTLITGSGALLPWGVADTSGTGPNVPIDSQFVKASTSLPFPMFNTGTLPSEPNFISNNMASPGFSCGELTFALALPATAAGAFVADASPLAGMGIELFDGAMSLGSISVGPRTLPDSFVGVVSSAPFTSVRFFALSTFDSWGLDDFEHNGGVSSGDPGCDGSAGMCPCFTVGAVDAGCPNSGSSTGAALVASGNAAVTNDTFQLSVSGAPASTAGIILSGTADLSPGVSTIPDSVGLLCVGGATARGFVVFTSATGDASFPDFQGAPYMSHPNVSAGALAAYTFWYRDPGSGAGCANDGPGSDFNFSNGWYVTVAP